MKYHFLSLCIMWLFLSVVACNSNNENSSKPNNQREHFKEKELSPKKNDQKTNNIPPVIKTSTIFPESWDPKRTFREDNETVLAWTHKLRDELEVKTCLLIKKTTDEQGKPLYFLTEKYSTKPPFTKWEIGFIYFAPDKHSTVGFYDSHLQMFDHKPCSKEIYDLLEQWKFHLSEENYTTLEAGTDNESWQKLLGFTWKEQG